jgi:hypothetical protein
VASNSLLSDITDLNGNVISDTVLGLVKALTATEGQIDTNGPGGDAFGRHRMSEPETLFDSKLLYGKSLGTYWSERLNGGGTSTHSTTHSCVDMTVAADGDYAIRQTKQRINYQPGKSQLFLMTGIIGFGTGITSRIGAFHGGIVEPYTVLDGICFESIDGVVYCCIYKGGVRTHQAAQDDWSVDTMNGDGPSQVNIDWTKAQIFMIDYEWLGVGRVRLGLNVDGVTYYVHSFNNANVVTNVYMRSGNQPVRYELRSTGGAGAMKHICASVMSEGGFNPKGLQAHAGPGNTSVAIGTGWELIYAIRLKSSQLDAAVIVESLSIMSTSNVNYEVGLFWNPVIAGTLTWTDLQGAAIQEAIGDGTTHNVTPIIQMYGDFSERTIRAKSEDFETSLILGADIDGTSDVIALAARTLATTGIFYGGLQLKQLT